MRPWLDVIHCPLVELLFHSISIGFHFSSVFLAIFDTQPERYAVVLVASALDLLGLAAPPCQQTGLVLR